MKHREPGAIIEAKTVEEAITDAETAENPEEAITTDAGTAEGGKTIKINLDLKWEEVLQLLQVEVEASEMPTPPTLVALHEYLCSRIAELSSQGLDATKILTELQAENPLYNPKLTQLQAEKNAIALQLETAYENAFANFQTKYSALATTDLTLFIKTTKLLVSLETESNAGLKEGKTPNAARYTALKTLAGLIDNNPDLSPLFTPFQSFSALWEKSLQIEQTIATNAETIAATKQDPLYRVKFLAARSITPDLINRYLSFVKEEKTRTQKSKQLSEVNDQITNTQASIATLQEEEARLIELLNKTREQLRKLKKELGTINGDLKNLLNEQQKIKRISVSDTVASPLSLLVNRSVLRNLYDKEGEEPSENAATDTPTEQGQSTTTARQIPLSQMLKIDAILNQADDKAIYRDLKVPDIYEVLLAAGENRLAERDFNLLWSYFILHKGDLSQIKKDCQHIPALNRLLETYFPATIPTIDDENPNNFIENNNSDLLDEACRRLVGRKIALVASKNTPFSSKFAQRMQEILRAKQIEAEIIHLCVTEIAKIPRLFAEGRINLVTIHYSFCRPPEIKATRNTCRPADKNNADRSNPAPDTPFFLVPYETSAQNTLIFIAGLGPTNFNPHSP